MSEILSEISPKYFLSILAAFFGCAAFYLLYPRVPETGQLKFTLQKQKAMQVLMLRLMKIWSFACMEGSFPIFLKIFNKVNFTLNTVVKFNLKSVLTIIWFQTTAKPAWREYTEKENLKNIR